MAAMDDSEKILAALRTTGRPMDALEIAKAIGYKRRKEVNRVIYKMNGVEISNPGVDPPLWRLIGSGGGSSAAASTAREGATPYCTAREPLEAARTREGREAAGQLASQLAKVTLGDDKSATLDNKLIATIEKTEGGGLLISAIPREQLISKALGASNAEPEQQGESRPVQETGSPNRGPETSGENAESSSKKVDPINLDTGHEQLLENDKIEDNPSSKEKDFATKVLENNTPGGGAIESQGTSTDQAASTPTAKTKKKPMIAANFGGVAAQETPDSLKKKILDILREKKTELSTWDITKRLGHENRIAAHQMLEELKREGEVNDTVRDGLSYWGIRNQE